MIQLIAVFRMIRQIIFIFALLPICLYATEYKPWFGKFLEIETRSRCDWQFFNDVDTSHGRRHHSGSDGFFNIGASLSAEIASAEFEVIGYHTNHRSLGWDSLKLTGRYPILNDIIGDPVSLVVGLTIDNVFHPALRNLAAFHHGGIGCEANIAIGKEYSCMQFWTSRWWGALGMGIADIGSPWVRFNASWEHNWWDRHVAEIFLHTLWGLGGNDLNLHRFHGYGPIHHQSVDLGVRYAFNFDYGIALSIEYGYRVYALNCPENVNLVAVWLLYPLSL